MLLSILYVERDRIETGTSLWGEEGKVDDAELENDEWYKV
jgi:hypothetical protein